MMRDAVCLHMYQLARDDEAIRANEGLACGADSLLAVGSEGNIGAARVLSAEGPFCFAVADEEQSRRGHGGLDVFGGGRAMDGRMDGWTGISEREADLANWRRNKAGPALDGKQGQCLIISIVENERSKTGWASSLLHLLARRETEG